MKDFSEFVTVVAAGALSVAAAALPATAADRPAGDATRPTYQDPAGRPAQRPPQSGVHADYHIDARVRGTDRNDGTEPRVREDTRDERLERGAPAAERYTRPPYRWSR